MVQKRPDLQISFFIAFLASIFIVNATLINNHQAFAQSMESSATETNAMTPTLDQKNSSNPILSVEAACMIAQPDIPGTFNASGFQPNTPVVIEFNRNNSTNASPTEAITVLDTEDSDSTGNLNGTFTLHSDVGPSAYREYFLHIYDFNNSQEAVTVSLDIC